LARGGAQHKRSKLQSNTEAQAKHQKEVRAVLLALAEKPISLKGEEESKDSVPRLTNVAKVGKAQTGRLRSIVFWNSKRFDDSVSLSTLPQVSDY
jgi:hypothetical protein